MKGINKNIAMVFILVVLYTIVKVPLQYSGMGNKFTMLINPFVWLLLLGLSIYVTYGEKRRIKAKTEKIQTVLITIMIYLIIYYVSGFIFGYQRSPYNHSVLALIQNTWAFILVAICQEYVRDIVCLGKRIKWYWFIVIVLLFSIQDLSFYRIERNFADLETTFKYVSATIIPLFAKNMLFTYLVIVGGYGTTLVYRIPLLISSLIMPLFPNHAWFWSALFDLILVLVVFIQVNYIHQKRITRQTRRSLRKEKLSRQIPTILILIAFVSFISGMFKYMPVAIMSNSMADLIDRGDVVIIEKLNDKEKDKLKLNDIIQYALDGSSVVHRIVDIIEINDNDRMFITKGDHNNAEDIEPVYYDQVKGKVLLKVKKVGYPSVILQEMFRKSGKPNVET